MLYCMYRFDISKYETLLIKNSIKKLANLLYLQVCANYLIETHPIFFGHLDPDPFHGKKKKDSDPDLSLKLDPSKTTFLDNINGIQI